MLTATTAERAVPGPSLACEGCGSCKVRPSLGRRTGDKEKASNGNWPYRCLGCGLRFYSSACSSAPKSTRRRRTLGQRIRSSWKHHRGLAVRTGVFLLMLLMFFFCLRYLTHYQPDNSSSRSLTPGSGVQIYRITSRPARNLQRYVSVVS
jgi:hypothetical protein